MLLQKILSNNATLSVILSSLTRAKNDLEQFVKFVVKNATDAHSTFTKIIMYTVEDKKIVVK